MEIEAEKEGGGEGKKMKLKLQVLESEPNLWKVIEDGDPDEVAWASDDVCGRFVHCWAFGGGQRSEAKDSEYLVHFES